MTTKAPTKLVEIDVGSHEQITMRRLARELAMDILPREVIYELFDLDDDKWSQLAKNPRFVEMLKQETQVWGTALNTRERIDLKTLSMIEEALPAMWELMHDKSEPAAARVEVFMSHHQGPPWAGLGCAWLARACGWIPAVTAPRGSPGPTPPCRPRRWSR